MAYEETTEQTEQKPQEEIVNRVLKLKASYEQASRAGKDEIAEIYSAYMAKMEEVVTEPYNSKENVPKLRTLIAFIKPFIFSGEPEVEVEGVGDEDKAISKIFEKIINYRFRTIKNFNNKIESWVGQSVGFGTSVLRVIWKFETKPQTGVGPDGQPYQFETPVMDEPDIEVPNILDVYYNPIIPTIEEQECLIFRSVHPVDAIKKNPIYDYVDEAGVLTRETIEGGTGNNGVSQFNSSSLSKTDLAAHQKAMDGMVEVLELVDRDRITTICGGKVLRDKANPDGFINAVKNIFEQNIIPNRFDGIGTGQNTMSLGTLFYKMFNQAKMNVTLGNNPMFLGAKGINVDKRHLVSRPGGIAEVDTNGRPLGDVIQAIQFPDLSAGFGLLLEKVEDELQRASGANDLIQGAASNDTLGQDKLAQANISNRFEVIVRRFKDDLAKVADMILKMELSRLQSPDAEILRIFPEELREQIYQVLINERENVKYNIKIKGETNVARNKNADAQGLENLYNLSQNFLTDREKRAMLRRVAEKRGEENIDEIIMENNPMADQQEQMMAMQGMMPGGEQPEQGMITRTNQQFQQ